MITIRSRFQQWVQRGVTFVRACRHRKECDASRNCEHYFTGGFQGRKTFQGITDRELPFMTFRELFPTLRMPIQDEGNRGCCGIADGLVDQDALAVGGNVVVRQDSE